MKKIVLLLIALTGAAATYAQQPRDSFAAPASLDQCIRYALTHQPLIAGAATDEEITAANIRGRLADWYPQVGAAWSLQHNFQRPTSVFNGSPVPVGTANSSTGQLYLNQALFNRDVLLALRSQGDLRLQARQATSARKIDLAVAVSKSFYDILTTQQQVRVTDENIARLQKSYNDAYQRYRSGVSDKTDYKRAQIALNNALALRRSNETALDGRIAVLRSLLGYPEGAPLAIAYDSARLERDIAFDTLQRPDAAQRIEFQQLSTQRRLQETALRYQRWSYLPAVSASAVYNLNYLNNQIGKLYADNFPNSYFGISAALPIFQGGRRKAAIRTAQLSLARTDFEIENVRNTVSSQFATALAAYQGQLANYRAIKENVQLARDVFEVLQLQYRAGIKTYFEVISAETDLHTAQINYFNALNAVLSAKVDAERALGQYSY
ncbi:TolC family protein [Flaviaesturariibacter flavus]|uniref:TolC family protein n=1 Tax=Flaviaesturariibacter flavus TaxID=2502780 RepID=A0A4R1B229_9BACT|nr:TolC family protein [Flaviaesturariibacter flavus]TCJ12102.1 TolC family protein [Flaviaesturariibacter flavus]